MCAYLMVLFLFVHILCLCSTDAHIIKGAMSDRIEDIRKGYMILLPVLDDKGRAIIYANPALMEGKVDEVSV